MDTHSDLQTWILDSVHAQTFLHMHAHKHIITHTYTHSHHPWPGQSRQGQRQGSLYRCTSLLFIHVIQARITREGWSGGWKGRRGLHGLHSTPTLLPSAHPLPLAEASPHPTPPPVPPHTHIQHTDSFPSSTTSAPRPQSLLLQHGSVLKRTHGKGQTDPRLPGPHRTWPGTEGGREEE